MRLIPVPYRILAIALLIVVVWGHGYTRGVTNESNKRDAAALKAERQMWAGFARAIQFGREAAAELLNAERDRDSYYHELQRRARDAKNRDLAVPNCPGDGPRPGALAGADPDRPACFVTWNFVGMWDGSWTDVEGKPVFGDPVGAAARALQASPVDPRGLLENLQHNAKLCSSDRARLAKLTGLLDKLEKDWEQRHKNE